MAIASGSIYSDIPNATDYLILINGFVVFGAIGCLLVSSRFDFSLREFFSGWKLKEGGGEDFAFAILLLFLGLLSALSIYFYYVPYDCTGLFAMLQSPGLLNAVRELSLKLLPDSIPKYTYSIFRAVLLPLLVSVLVLYFHLSVTRRNYTKSVATAILVVVLRPLSMIVGAKGDAVYVMLVIAITFMVAAKSLRAQLFFAGGAVIFGVVLMTSITLLVAKNFSVSEATIKHFHACEKGLNQEGIIDYYLKRYSFDITETKTIGEGADGRVGSVYSAVAAPKKVLASVQLKATGDRIINTPTMVAGWYFDFVKQQGFVGVAGLPRLASLSGVLPIDLPNIIGVRYAENGEAQRSISAVTGYVVWWYACFGLVSLLASLVALWLLDAVLFILVRCLNGVLRVPTYAVIMVISTKFVESDWGVVLITHGFLIVVISAIVVDQTSRFLARRTLAKHLV